MTLKMDNHSLPIIYLTRRLVAVPPCKEWRRGEKFLGDLTARSGHVPTSRSWAVPDLSSRIWAEMAVPLRRALTSDCN